MPESPSPAPTEGKESPPPAKPARAPRSSATSPKPATAPAKTPSAAPTKPRRPAGKPAATKAKAPAAKPPAIPAAKPPVARKAPPTPSGTVVDVSGLVLGRAASLIAQRLLRGEHIVVVHAERSVVTGARPMVLEHYRAARARGSVRSGPHFPRFADRIFRRTVRGMLPHLKQRGRDALDRLQVHMGLPPEFGGQPATSLETARAQPSLRRPLTLAEITQELGGRT